MSRRGAEGRSRPARPGDPGGDRRAPRSSSSRGCGYHATSMRALAAAADVQPAAIYHWYPSKEAILVAAPGRLHGAAHRAGRRRRWTASDRPALRLAAAVREHVVFHGIHRRAAFVTDSEIRALDRRAARAR